MRKGLDDNPENAAAPATVTGEVRHSHWRHPGRQVGRRRQKRRDPQAGRPASASDMNRTGCFGVGLSNGFPRFPRPQRGTEFDG
ncbi:hypothetical protein shim_17770 [Shimia sp. SK013]|nr:hypothetical protein shim_17770 [Shimia sp. SK013]